MAPVGYSSFTLIGNLHFNENYKLISIEFRNELNEKVYQRNPLQIQISFSVDMQCMKASWFTFATKLLHRIYIFTIYMQFLMLMNYKVMNKIALKFTKNMLLIASKISMHYISTLCRSKVWIGIEVCKANSIILGTRKLRWFFSIKQILSTTASFL